MLKNIGVNSAYLLDNRGNIVYEIKERLIYVLEPNLEGNKYIYNKLFLNDWEYIFHADYQTLYIFNKKYIHVLNISNKYKIYVQLKNNMDSFKLDYISTYISCLIADELVINKVSNIKRGINGMDIMLNTGKDIYAIPGNIFEYENYLANFAIKQGAVPICGKYDIQYLLLQKYYKKI